MAPIPQLPLDIILTILNERKEIKRNERIEKDAKEKYNNFVNAFNIGVKAYITQELFQDADTIMWRFSPEINEKHDDCKSYDDIIELMDSEGITIQECLDCNVDEDDHFNDNALSYWVEHTEESKLRTRNY